MIISPKLFNASSGYNVTGNRTDIDLDISYKEWTVWTDLPTAGVVAAFFLLVTRVVLEIVGFINVQCKTCTVLEMFIVQF